MPSVKELKALAEVDVQQFRTEHGPVALIQQPPDPVFQRVAMQLGQGRTVFMAHRSRLAERLMTMLEGFDYLDVLFLKPKRHGHLFTVGRVESCDLLVHEPSVSKQHAYLKWDQNAGTCWVRDAGSTNGTFVNAQPLGPGQEHQLFDGDGLAFGDAQFLYLLSNTLHAHLGLLHRSG